MRWIAAVERLLWKEMRRLAAKNTTLRQLLLNACVPARCEWYFNNLRHRHGREEGEGGRVHPSCLVQALHRMKHFVQK